LHGPPKGKRHVTLSVGRRIVAIAGVQVDPRDTRLLWVTHVSVEEDYRCHKFGRAIVEAVYEYALEQEKMVDPSSFTPMGKERIEHIFDELNARFPLACKSE
jgi:GNAT superfamily N-acetyltransferase